MSGVASDNKAGRSILDHNGFQSSVLAPYNLPGISTKPRHPPVIKPVRGQINDPQLGTKSAPPCGAKSNSKIMRPRELGGWFIEPTSQGNFQEIINSCFMITGNI